MDRILGGPCTSKSSTSEVLAALAEHVQQQFLCEGPPWRGGNDAHAFVSSGRTLLVELPVSDRVDMPECSKCPAAGSSLEYQDSQIVPSIVNPLSHEQRTNLFTTQRARE